MLQLPNQKNKSRALPHTPCAPGRGFTLIEIVLYTGILAVVGLIGTQFFLVISRSYFQDQARNEVTQNVRFVSHTMQQAVRAAAKVNTASSSMLDLAMTDAAKSPTVFTLANGVLYRQEGGGAQVALTSDKVEVTSLYFYSVATQQTIVDPVYHWAWNGGASSTSGIIEGVGWIDFNPPLGNVRVPLGQGDFYGYAYIPVSNGYISFNCETTSSCSAVNYKVYSQANGDIRGWAWSDQYGWISFSSADTTSTIAYQVAIATGTGDFSGWAWSENLGWISFHCNNSGIGDTCANSQYKVKVAQSLSRPFHAVRIIISIRYKASTSPFAQYSETHDFSTALTQPSAVTIANVNPGSATSTVSVTITGTNFQAGAEVKFSRVGEEDIFPTATCSLAGSTTFTCSFNVSGRTKAKWDVVVTNPDGQIGILPEGFEVQ